MPHLNFKNIDIEKVKNLSVDKNEELAKAFNCPEFDITYDVYNSTSIIHGEVVDGDKTIIIMMFDREQIVKDNVVSILEDYFNDITVIFQILDPFNYYEYGKNFS